jgi:hypothetical protein
MQFYIANVGHLLPYAVLLIAYLLLSSQSELLKSKIFAVSALGLLLVFIGFGEVKTPDMERYREMYEALGAGYFFAIEPSFIFLSVVFNALGFDYHILFFTYSFITLTFIYLGIRNYTNYIKLSLLFYILVPACFLNLFVEMREVSAVAIAFYATSLLRHKNIKLKKTRVLFFAILSIIFHYSAIVYWVVFFLTYRFNVRRHSFFLHLVLLSLSLLIPTSVLINGFHIIAYPFLPAKYQGYFNIFIDMESQLAESGQILKSIIYTLMASFFSYCGASLEENDDAHMSVNLFVIGVVILNLTRAFSDISRLAYFFLILQIILFPLFLEKIKNQIQALWCTYLVVIFYLAQFTWGLFYYSEETGSYIFLHYQNAIMSALR